MLYLLYQHNRITKNIYNNLMECILQIKKLVIPKDLPKDAGNNLEHEIYSIMKR